MEYINFHTPPFPYYIIAGSALYRPGDMHGRRSNIGLFDMIFIEYGELYITDGEKSYHLTENDLLIIKPDSTHFGYKRVSMKTKFDWLHFRSQGEYYYSSEFHLRKEERKSLNSYEDRKGILTLPIHKKLTPLERGEFVSVFSKLISANIDKYQQKEIHNQVFLTPLQCQELFFRLLSFVQVFQPQKNSSELLAANIMEYIMQNYHNHLTLEDIADYFNFHPVHVIRCMKKEYGITPNKALTQIRLDHAKKMLITSDLEISKIAEFVGFNTASYFNRVFKEYAGMTPKEYRRQHSQEENSNIY
ncbi:MAG TPA: AraC family transcriptional regulator [Candidatus Blautia ornithocaccae]|nr:AraC family transcriptional regulator [Candidatus Blautia ornithocaccae]